MPDDDPTPVGRPSSSAEDEQLDKMEQRLSKELEVEKNPAGQLAKDVVAAFKDEEAEPER